MAVGAYWNQVLNWINYIAASALRYEAHMMDVDEAYTQLAVIIRKIDSADDTRTSVMLNTS